MTVLPATSRPWKSAAVPSPTHTTGAVTPPALVGGDSVIGNTLLSGVVLPAVVNAADHEVGYHSGRIAISSRRMSERPSRLNSPITQSWVMRS
jgi:hypothetical protein